MIRSRIFFNPNINFVGVEWHAFPHSPRYLVTESLIFGWYWYLSSNLPVVINFGITPPGFSCLFTSTKEQLFGYTFFCLNFLKEQYILMKVIYLKLYEKFFNTKKNPNRIHWNQRFDPQNPNIHQLTCIT